MPTSSSHRSPRTRAFVALLLAGLAACGAKAAPAPRHVLFVLVDTLRADRLAPYAYERETSPFLAEFVKDAAVFETAISQSSWTAPSMISIMTGREVAGEDLAAPADTALLAELFRERGWRTGAFVNNPLIYNRQNGFARGFERFEHERFAKRAAKWMRETATEDSFTYVHFVTPHDPYAPLEKFHHFVGTKGVIPAEQQAYYAGLEAQTQATLTPAATARIERGLNGYDDDIRRWDESFRELVDVLRETGQLENTTIVIASDHGEGLWTRASYAFGPHEVTDELDSHLKMTHGGQLYEELTHVPLIVRTSATRGGQRHAGVVSNVDILPTLCELADLPLPAGASGRSLVPALTGRASPDDATRLAMSATRYARSLRGPRYKLIEPTKLGRESGLTTEFYDLETDPKERTSCADEFPDLVREYQAELERRVASAILRDANLADLSAENQGAMQKLGYTE